MKERGPLAGWCKLGLHAVKLDEGSGLTSSIYRPGRCTICGVEDLFFLMERIHLPFRVMVFAATLGPILYGLWALHHSHPLLTALIGGGLVGAYHDLLMNRRGVTYGRRGDS